MTYQNIFCHQDIVTVSVIMPVPNLPSSQNHQQLYGIAILQGKKIQTHMHQWYFVFVDVNFNLQKVWKFLKKKSADKI